MNQETKQRINDKYWRRVQMFQPIAQVKTGIKLKKMLKAAGYEVRDIQKYLHVSCPQSIYRWFKGKILPSVEHLCALSKISYIKYFMKAS